MTSWGQGLSGGSAGAQQMTGAQSAATAIQQPSAAAAAGIMAAAYPMQQFQVNSLNFTAYTIKPAFEGIW